MSLFSHPQGVLRMGQEVEVRPGIITKDAEGRVKCIPVFSRVVSLFAEQVHNLFFVLFKSKFR